MNRVKLSGLILLLVIALPFIFLWLLLDHAQLKQCALEEQPMDAPRVYTTVAGRCWGWFLRNVVGAAIAFIVLPIIVIIGMFELLLTEQPDETTFF